MTTNAYIRGVKELNWTPFHGKLWQRNYYEHIIRDGNDYDCIAKYIQDNPVNCQGDDLFLDISYFFFNSETACRSHTASVS